MEINTTHKNHLVKLTLVFMAILTIFVFVKTLSEWRGYTLLSGDNMGTISLSGYGEVSAVPDIAEISFTISHDAKTVKEAQATVADVEGKVLAFLAENNIAEKDIKTTNASFYPKYEYQTTSSGVCTTYGCTPREGRNVVVGYTASESINVKVRDVDNAGTIVTGLGELKVSNLNGPNFSIDDETSLQALARKKAIDEADAKAQVLARDLGVKIVRVINFNEGGGYGVPMYSRDAMMTTSVMESAPKLNLSKGENIISSNVTITYEIR